MLAKLKAACFNSVTVAWSYVLAAGGLVLQLIDAFGDIAGDPNIKDQLSVAIGDAKIVGRILLGISIVNIIARARTLKKGS